LFDHRGIGKSFDAGRLANLPLRAIWTEEQDISDSETIGRIIAAQGKDPVDVLASARSPAVRQMLDDNTREAQSRSVFGSTFYFLGKEIFWGQDRLDFLDASLARATNIAFPSLR